MRNIYLVRHGRPDFEDGIRRCIGRTEIALDEAGRRQALELKEYFLSHPVSRVYTSPLGRCRETAQILAGERYPVTVIDGLKELDMGEWENVPLKELKKNLESEPEHGEKRADGLLRIRKTVEGLISVSGDSPDEDIVCVAHAGINCCYLSHLLGSRLETSRALPQPYGGFSRIEVLPDGRLKVAELGRMPKEAPDEKECEAIWEHYHTPENVQRHCRAVCREAVRMGRRLNETGCRLNLDLIRSASLLHDVARMMPDHAAEGAGWIRREGYPEVAEIVRAHHDLDTHKHNKEQPDETDVVYLADKLVCGETVVTIENRFADSLRRHKGKWDSEEAGKAYARRFDEAKRVQRLVQHCGIDCR